MYTAVVLNCVLLGGLLLWYLLKRELFTVGGVLYLIYSLSAICGLFIVRELVSIRPLQFSVYATLFFFIAFLLFTRPLIICDKNVSKRISMAGYDYTLLIYIYIIAATLEVVILAPKILSMDFGDLLAYYNLAEEEAQEHHLYDNAFQGIIINIVSYLRLPMIIIFFQTLSQNNVSKTRKLLLLLAVILPNFLYAVKVVSRAFLLSLFMSFLFCYIIYKDQISLQVKRIISIVLVSFATVLVSFLIIMTLSRFGEGAQDSVMFYFGHSMIYYNGAVVTPSHGDMGGAIFFDWFYDKLGIQVPGEADDIIGTTAGSSFKTFIGTRYIDFGPIGTLLYGFLLSSIIISVLKKKKISVAELYVYLFYVNWLFTGLFYDSLEAINWLMTFFIYFILKSPIFKKTRKNGNYSVLSAPISSDPS